MKMRPKWKVRKREAMAFGGGFLLISAAAAGGIVFADGERAGPPAAPDGGSSWARSVAPSENAVPKGLTTIERPVEGQTARWGRFELVAAGAISSDDWRFGSSEIQIREDVDPLSAAARQLAANRGVAIAPPPDIPGFRAALGSAKTAILAGKPEFIAAELFVYESIGLPSVEVFVTIVRPQSSIQFNGGPSGYKVGAQQLGDAQVVVSASDGSEGHQSASRAWILIGDFLATVHAPTYPPAVLMDFVNGFIAARGDQYRTTTQLVEGTK